MGVHHHRKRMDARTPQGGGLTEPSLTDTATDDDIMEHDTGEGPAGLLSSVDIDWDEAQGPFGVRSDLPPADPYTVDEAVKDLSQFARPYLPRADDVRDVAQLWQVGTVTLQPGAEAYNIAGADPLRKRIEIRNVTTGDTVGMQTADVFVGTRDVQARGGSGAAVIRADYTDAGVGNFLKGDPPLVSTSQEEVWVIPAVYPGVAGVAVTVTYMIERYTK